MSIVVLPMVHSTTKLHVVRRARVPQWRMDCEYWGFAQQLIKRVSRSPAAKKRLREMTADPANDRLLARNQDQVDHMIWYASHPNPGVIGPPSSEQSIISMVGEAVMLILHREMDVVIRGLRNGITWPGRKR